jgi:hypothetical protein
MPFAPLGTTVQFTDTVSGLSNTAVKWSAGGALGGNASNGFISNSGLYTAPPTMPGQNPVQIVATSVSNPSLKASTYVYLLTAGPAITSVSPNPLPTRTYTVTIQGTGFKSGALINNSGIQLFTTFVNSNTVAGTGLSPNTSFNVTTSGGAITIAPATEFTRSGRQNPALKLDATL